MTEQLGFEVSSKTDSDLTLTGIKHKIWIVQSFYITIGFMNLWPKIENTNYCTSVEYETISPKEPITDDSKSFTFHFMMRHANDWTALSELAMNLAVSYEKHDGTQWNGVDTKDTAIVVNNLLSNMWQEIVIRLNQVYYIWYN